MILFLEDWKKYPDAIPHTNTKNKSFLRYVGLLKSMGVKNHAFCLQLHNPLLKYVDPFDPNNSAEVKRMISDELVVNFFYFLREVARIELPGSPDPSMFLANRGNISTSWLFFNYITVFLQQIRQTGKSATINMILKGVTNYMASNTSVTLITKDNKLREDNTIDLQRVEGYLPQYLKRVTVKDMDSTDGITVKSSKNKINIKLAQKSIEAAKNLNRGSTDTIIAVDEVPYLYNIATSLPVALSAGSRAIRSAKEIGQPAGIILYTSAGYLDTESGAYAYQIYKDGAKWSETCFDLENREELEAYVEKHSSGRMKIMVVEMNHEMLGYTDEWLSETLDMVNPSKTQAMVEYLNIWVKGGTDALIPKELVDKLYANISHPPPATIESEGFGVIWHTEKSIVAGLTSVIAIDMSELLGKDSASLIVGDTLNGGTLATGKYGKANINEFGMFVFNLMLDLPKSTLMIERNNMGIAVLDQLASLFAAKGMNIFERVYNTIVDDGRYSDIIVRKTDSAFQYVNYKETFGFRTSSGGRHSRSSLYNRVVEVASLCVNHIVDKYLIEELCGIEIRKNRIDHKIGENDDMVIAYMLFHWFLKEGKNLYIYGINASLILTGIILSKDKKEELEDREEREETEKIVREVDKLIDRLKAAIDDPIRTLNIRAKLSMLNSRIGTKVSKTLNIHGRLLDILKESKRKK